MQQNLFRFIGKIWPFKKKHIIKYQVFLYICIICSAHIILKFGLFFVDNFILQYVLLVLWTRNSSIKGFYAIQFLPLLTLQLIGTLQVTIELS